MSSAADFDFLIGDWDVANEKLAKRLTGSTDWTHFGATATCRKILNGAGNMDEMTLPDSGFAGLTLRIFNPVDGNWSLHWADNDRHRMLPPMVGRFADGKGIFYGNEEHEGRVVRCRFLWASVPGAPRWEQAFSGDNGESWETNWIMRFSRRG